MSDPRKPALSILSAFLIFASSFWTSEVLAQSGCEGCSGSYQGSLDADAAREKCPEGDEVWCYQRYMAAQSKFTSCLNRGCDTGMPTGNDPQGSGSGEGSGGADGVGDSGSVPDPDSDGDGVPDRADTCSGTTAGLIVDEKGCPAKMELTISTDAWNDKNELIESYAPGARVNVSGTVKDARGNPIPGASLLIELEGAGLSTMAGTIVDSAYYRSSIDLPLEIKQGTYTLTATASKDGYADVSKSTTIVVTGLEFFVRIDSPVNAPIGESTAWKISVLDREYQHFSDAQLRIVVTHLDSGKSTTYSALSQRDWGHSTVTPDYIWKFTWLEQHQGNWQIEVTATKKGFLAHYRKKLFTVGAHIVELEDLSRDVSCSPYCSTHCEPDQVIIDNPSWDTTDCYVKGECSLGHPVRYEWTADAGSISRPTSDSTRWKPPEAPGSYKVTARVICTEDPAVLAGKSMPVEAVTDAQFNKAAYHGKIEMRGFDKVKVEKVEGDWAEGMIPGVEEALEDDELKAGQWLEGDDWTIYTDEKTKVTLGVYKKGEKVGEVLVDGDGFYRLKSLRRSTFGWLNSSSSPYTIFIDVVPDRRYKEIDFSVSTGTCTASDRGTKYFVAFDENTAMNTIGVLEGEVEVTPLLFEAAPKVVTAHQWTTVDEVVFGSTREMTQRQIGELEEIFAESADGPATEVVSKPPGDQRQTGGFHFIDDFSGDLEEIAANWNVDDLYVELDNGRLFFEPDDEVWDLKLYRRIPLQGIVVEFDGWTEGQGLHIVFSNDRGDKFNASLGSGKYAGISLFSGNTAVATVRGPAFEAGVWSRFKLTQRDGVVEVSVDGKPVISGEAPGWMKGDGRLSISANGRPAKVDNVKIYELR